MVGLPLGSSTDKGVPARERIWSDARLPRRAYWSGGRRGEGERDGE